MVLEDFLLAVSNPNVTQLLGGMNKNLSHL
jgi:hypothetical protein